MKDLQWQCFIMQRGDDNGKNQYHFLSHNLSICDWGQQSLDPLNGYGGMFCRGDRVISISLSKFYVSPLCSFFFFLLLVLDIFRIKTDFPIHLCMCYSFSTVCVEDENYLNGTIPEQFSILEELTQLYVNRSCIASSRGRATIDASNSFLPTSLGTT